MAGEVDNDGLSGLPTLRDVADQVFCQVGMGKTTEANIGRLGIGLGRFASSSIPSTHVGERLIYLMIALLIVTGMILARFAPEFLQNQYLMEDGIVEWFTVAILLFCAALCFRRVLRLRHVRPTLFLVSLSFIGSMFIFGAAEELSWGQRILSIETPEWFKERNKQQELNVHNLMVGDVSINKVVFGQLLRVVLTLYLFLLPWMANRSPRVNGVVERLGLPLPTFLQALVFIPALILPDLLIDSTESDELLEACGCLMLVILFCYPKNGYIYSPDWRVGQG